MRELETEKLVTLAPERRSAFAAPPVTDKWVLLSGLRFLLALLVFMQHAPYRCLHPTWLDPFTASGSAAVVCFFVISGYSIAHSADHKPSGFLRRRFWRIYPTYFTCLLLSMLPFTLFGNALRVNSGEIIVAPDTPLSFFCNLFMLQGVVTPAFVLYGASWSLQCESVFYLCVPLLRMFSHRVAVVMMILSALFYIWFRHPGDLPTSTFELATICLAWAWLAGWLLYHIPKNRFLQFCVLACGCAMTEQWQAGWLTAPLWIATVFAAMASDSVCLIPARLSSVLTWLGELSYPLYLVHGPTVWFLLAAFHTVSLWAALASSILASLALYYLVDKPLRRRYHRAADISIEAPES